LALFFIPETKALTLEELDQVFSVSTRKHAAHQWRQVPIWIQRNVFRNRSKPFDALYPWETYGCDGDEVVKGKKLNSVA
jgi:hypothetical protein